MFDIEEKMEAIPDPKTKELFKEVYSSYQHANYRSAVVMLWSVVIADIVFKLKFLDNTYHNKKAEKILEEIKKKQEKHPENPEWEKELLKKAYEELKFITLNDKINLEYLHTQRNLSAHPVLTDDNLLLAPSKDTTRSLIRNAIEAILLKTALLHSELVDSIVEDLAKNKDRLNSYENIKPYIQKRYFPNISNEGAIRILSALWRFVFNPHTQQELDNQNINYYALMIFFEKYKDIYKTEIQNNCSSYHVSSECIEKVILFLKWYPDLFNILDEALKTLIRSSISDINQYLDCDFLSNNLEEHYNNVLDRLQNEKLSLTKEQVLSYFSKAQEKGLNNLFIQICIKYYEKSNSYDTADERYYNVIDPLLSEYKMEDILLLIEAVNNNSQVYERRRAFWDHRNILKKFYELGGKAEQIDAFYHWKAWNKKYQEESGNTHD